MKDELSSLAKPYPWDSLEPKAFDHMIFVTNIKNDSLFQFFLR